MRAEITRLEDGYKAVFERELLQQDMAKVWSMLTENGNLQQWCPQLRITESGRGGKISYTHKDGTAEAMPIIEYQEGSIMAINWLGDEIRFEVEQEEANSLLRLIKKSASIASLTATDLAAWHIGLNRLETLLNSRENEEAQTYNELTNDYQRLLASMNIEFE